MPTPSASPRSLANASPLQARRATRPAHPVRFTADIFALFAYLVLAILLTYPLILRFSTHVAGDGSDDPALTWNLWWVPYAMINLGQSPIYTQHMFYPIGLDLAFYTLTYLNAALAIPIQYAFNLVIAANVNLLLSFTLSGFGGYLLVKYLLQEERLKGEDGRLNLDPSQFFKLQSLAAFAAGSLYAFSSNKFLYAALGQFNIASSHWIPFYVLFLIKITIRPSHALRVTLRYGFWLGLFLLFQSLSEFIHASFLIIFTFIYLACWLVIQRKQLPSAIRHLLFALTPAVLVFLIPMLPIVSALTRDTLVEGDIIQQGLGFADVFSNDVIGFFVPSHLHPFLGDYEARFHFSYINFGYLGYVALFLALSAVIAVPRARRWAIFAAIFLLISLGPTLHVNGAAMNAPFLPFNLLLEIPFVKGNRYPSRWSVMLTLALAVLAGYALMWLMQRFASPSGMPRNRQSSVARRILLLVVYFSLLTASLFEHLSIPLPVSNFQIPDVYQTIARDRGDFSVLELPLAWRNGFRMTGPLDQAMMFAQFYQTAHTHPILGGNTSRNPEFKFQYFTEAPVIDSLIAVETGHELDPPSITRDRALGLQVLRFFGIKYIVWHSPRDPQNRFALDAARAYVEALLPVTKFYDTSDETGDIAAYRVNGLTPLNQTIIHPNDPLARLNFGEGWGAMGGSAVWATRSEAKVFWRLDQPRDSTLSFRLYSPVRRQFVRVLVNGHNAGRIAMSDGWGEFSIQVERDLWRAGMNEIVLQFDSLVSVTSMNAKQASIVAYSAGMDVGDFARIFVNGVDSSPNERGYNVVVVDPVSGAVEARAAFDTFASEQESARLAQFIAQIPQGRILALAVRDEASRNLTQDAVEALRSIGAKEDLRGRFRASHAVIGVKGAATALERANEIAPAQVVQGIGAMEPHVAAAVEWIAVK